MVQNRGCTGFPEIKHRLFPEINTGFGLSGDVSEDARGSLAEVRRVHAQTVEGRMEEEPPSWLISAILFAWAWVDTCHP
jgi:hypothetical protein